MKTISVDLVVVGSTPGGIVCAVRAAREGLRVLLTNYHPKPGGMMAGGLGGWESLCEDDARAPIYAEMRRLVFEYYRNTFGADSQQYQDARYRGLSNGHVEPRVAVHFFTELIEREAGLTFLTPYYPESATSKDGRIVDAVFRRMDSDERVRVEAAIFADCTYEGDFLAAAGVPFRLGREARSEYGESRAGKIFMSTKSASRRDPYLHTIHSQLNLSSHTRPPWQLLDFPGAGEGDNLVQAINYRTMLSADPANRVLPSKPKDYDPAQYANLEFDVMVMEIPNRKGSWNRPQLLGLQNAYVEGNWEERKKVLDRFWKVTVGLLYYMQNDAPLKPDHKALWRSYGFAIDEGIDEEHPPCEIYVREGRRLVGRTVLIQSDAQLAPGLPRTPLKADSIAFADFLLDCHACSDERLGDSAHEGKIALFGESFPYQIPYGCIVSKTFANVLAPVPLSASHVAFGGVRLEPAWMNIGESAGYAAALAVRKGITPAEITPDILVRRLARARVALIFFNDVGLIPDEQWFPAVQYWGTKGFFPSFEARPHDMLTQKVARQWLEIVGQISQPGFDPNEAARDVMAKETGDTLMSAIDWDALLREKGFRSRNKPMEGQTPTRADACMDLFESLDFDS